MDETLLKLSPSSAADFKSCPQLFKYRSVDDLPEPVTPAQARGSLVHVVLERLFSEQPDARTPARAEALLAQAGQELSGDPEFTPEGLEGERARTWLDDGRRLLGNLFKLEDPAKLAASRLEWWVEYELEDLHLRGIIDRVEERPDGSWILSDYKTGRVPNEARELAASFGLRFYALVCWRSFGVLPREIRLVYLNDPAVLTWNPNPRSLEAFERQMVALGKAIRRALDTGDWRARPSPFCMSCSFQRLCPAWENAASKAPS